MDKVKQEHIVLHCKELLTGDELIQAVKTYNLENHFIEKIEIRTLFDKPQFNGKIGYFQNKPSGIEYVYIFVDKAVLKNANNTK